MHNRPYRQTVPHVLLGILVFTFSPLFATQPDIKPAVPTQIIQICPCPCPKQKSAIWGAIKTVSTGAVLIYLTARIGEARLPALAYRVLDVEFEKPGSYIINTYENLYELAPSLWNLADCCGSIRTTMENGAHVILGTKNNDGGVRRAERALGLLVLQGRILWLRARRGH